jgi:hypothetical protein
MDNKNAAKNIYFKFHGTFSHTHTDSLKLTKNKKCQCHCQSHFGLRNSNFFPQVPGSFPGCPDPPIGSAIPRVFCLLQTPLFVHIYLKIKCANCMSSILPHFLPILALAFSANIFSHKFVPCSAFFPTVHFRYKN